MWQSTTGGTMTQESNPNRISSSVMRELPEMSLEFDPDGEAVIHFPNGTKLNTHVFPHGNQRELVTNFFASPDGREIIMRMHNEAIYDSLTGLHRRAPALSVINEHLKRLSSMNFEGVVSVIVLDLDFFKKVNDTHGHTVGDKVLHWFGEIIKHSTRIFDTSIRWGGDEFVIFLTTRKPKELIVDRSTRTDDRRTPKILSPTTPEPYESGTTTSDMHALYRGARVVANRICKDTQSVPCIVDDRRIRQKVTIALASQYIYPTTDTEGLFDTLFERADGLLIQQKQLDERNQVHEVPLQHSPKTP